GIRNARGSPSTPRRTALRRSRGRRWNTRRRTRSTADRKSFRDFARLSAGKPPFLGFSGRVRKIHRFEDFRPQGFLDAGIAQAEETRAIGRVAAHTGFEYPDDPENPQWVVGDVHFSGGVDVYRFVLADWRLAAIIA